MAQMLRALIALLEVLSSVPSNHMVAYNHGYDSMIPSSDVHEDRVHMCVCVCVCVCKSSLKHLIEFYF